MKKAIISTYTYWNSYGSIFQSLGLQLALKKLGVDPYTVVFATDECPAVERKKPKISLSYLSHLYQIVNRRKLEKCRESALHFIRNNINQVRLQVPSDIALGNTIFDAYIAGSDQIWNPTLHRDDFFLCYAPTCKRRISYAASMGCMTISEETGKRFSRLLRNFDVISVREEEMIPVISKYTERSVLRHIDPTFLVPANTWREYEKPYDENRPFILVYALYWDRSLNAQLRKLHEETGFPIVSIQQSIRVIYSNQIVLDASPEEFLWLIDHAEAVITSSFHGAALSIIMNKRFFPVINPDAPSRIENLLSTLEIRTAESIENVMSFEIDYSNITARIEAERQRGLEYLQKEIIDEQ